jgi:hypothetical protein
VGQRIYSINKKDMSYAAHVRVGGEKMTIETNNVTKRDVFYSDIYSCTYQSFRCYELRIKLLDGSV